MSFIKAAYAGVRTAFIVSRQPTLTYRSFFKQQIRFNSIEIKNYNQFADEVLSSQQPVVVAIHADCSGPCRIYLPRVEAVAGNYEGIIFAKVDIDDCYDVPEALAIEDVPTLLGYYNGEQLYRMEGVVDDDSLYGFCDAVAQAVDQVEE